MSDPAVCEHNRTAATCEACAHAAALRDPRRAAATRDELYPFPDGAALSTGFLDEDKPLPEMTPARKATARRKAS